MNYAELFTNNSKKIEIQFQDLFNEKLQKFREQYLSRKYDNPLDSPVVILSDFDYTITQRYNYLDNKCYESSYSFYDESILDGDQELFNQKQDILYKEYGQYEFNTSYDYKLRLRKMEEYYSKSLDLYINKKFKKEKIPEMIKKIRSKFEFREDTKQ